MTYEERVFSDKAETYLKTLNMPCVEDRTPGVRTVDRAIIMPRDRETDRESGKPYLTGVFDENRCFIAAGVKEREMLSDRDSCVISQAAVEKSEETVLFGGIFHLHFGVMLLLSTSRLWYLIEHPDTPYRTVFLAERSEKNIAENYIRSLTELLGISADRYMILKKPTQYARVIIPDEVLPDGVSGFDSRFVLPFRVIADRVIAEDGKTDIRRLYLSRTRFIKRGRSTDGINEEYYERFYEKRGFAIVHPQELSLREQVRLIASADEIVSTYGTLAHLISLFAQNGARQIMLLRAPGAEVWFLFQAAILKMTHLDWYLVDAAKNPFPTIHDNGAFLYFPTDGFRRFLDAMKLPYEENELHAEITDEQFRRYVLRWLMIYSNPEYFKMLNDPALFPLLESLFYNATGKRLPAEYYMESDPPEKQECVV